MSKAREIITSNGEREAIISGKLNI